MPENHQESLLRRMLRNSVPDSLLQQRQTFLRLGPKAGPIYARLRLLDLLRMASPNESRVPQTARSIAFVCFGNLMRSPMAEAFFRLSTARAGLTGIQICSAGIHAVPETKAHPWAIAASAEVGFDLSDHRAQAVTPALMSQSDIVFAMDFQNKAELLSLYPEFRHKILMLGVYADVQKSCVEIPDPYFGGLEATRGCIRILQTCVRNLTTELLNRRPATSSGLTTLATLDFRK
jgi:protein-tyrosine phosphatase